VVEFRALRTRSEFATLFSEGELWRGRCVNVRFVIERDDDEAEGIVKLGVSVPRRFGNAVRRNQLRRRIREVVRVSNLPPGSYLLSPRRSCDQIGFAGLKDDVTRLWGEGLGGGLKKVTDER
jgi:ribonuclease P protein component